VKQVIIINHIHAGQPRPYADSVYKAEILIRVEGQLTNGTVRFQAIKEDTVRSLAHLFVRSFNDNPGPFDPRLEVCEAIGPTPEMRAEAHPKWAPAKESRWRVRIVEPYTD